MIHEYLKEIGHNPFIILSAVAVMLDTILGFFRAIKEHKFNSTFGIDGAIRKSAMIVSVLFLMLADFVIKINLIFFIPVEIRETIGLTKVGLGEFFCILYIIYECISIMKNMYLVGLPYPAWMKVWLEKFLTEMTAEMKLDQKLPEKVKEVKPEG